MKVKRMIKTIETKMEMNIMNIERKKEIEKKEKWSSKVKYSKENVEKNTE